MARSPIAITQTLVLSKVKPDLSPVEIICACVNAAYCKSAGEDVELILICDQETNDRLEVCGLTKLYDKIILSDFSKLSGVDRSVHWSAAKILAHSDSTRWLGYSKVAHVDFDAFLNHSGVKAIARSDPASFYALQPESLSWEGYKHNRDRFESCLGDMFIGVDFTEDKFWKLKPLNTGIFFFDTRTDIPFIFRRMLQLINKIQDSGRKPVPLVDYDGPPGSTKYFEEVVFVEQRFMVMACEALGITPISVAKTQVEDGPDTYSTSYYGVHLCCHRRKYKRGTSLFTAFNFWAACVLGVLDKTGVTLEILSKNMIRTKLATDPFTSTTYLDD